MSHDDLQAMLRALAREDRDEPSDRVEQAVMRRWTEQHAAVPLTAGAHREPTRRTRPAARYAAMAAGVAASLLVIAWLAMRGPSPATREMAGANGESTAPAATRAGTAAHDDPGNAASAMSTAPAADDPPPAIAPAPARAVPAAAAFRTPADRPQRAAARVESFASLQPLTENDLVGVRMARVRLSASAAERLGLPGLRLGTDESIDADVLLGEDGMARAIRIVR